MRKWIIRTRLQTLGQKVLNKHGQNHKSSTSNGPMLWSQSLTIDTPNVLPGFRKNGQATICTSTHHNTFIGRMGSILPCPEPKLGEAKLLPDFFRKKWAGQGSNAAAFTLFWTHNVDKSKTPGPQKVLPKKNGQHFPLFRTQKFGKSNHVKSSSKQWTAFPPVLKPIFVYTNHPEVHQKNGQQFPLFCTQHFGKSKPRPKFFKKWAAFPLLWTQDFGKSNHAESSSKNGQLFPLFWNQFYKNKTSQKFFHKNGQHFPLIVTQNSIDRKCLKMLAKKRAASSPLFNRNWTRKIEAQTPRLSS